MKKQSFSSCSKLNPLEPFFLNHQTDALLTYVFDAISTTMKAWLDEINLT